VLKNNKNQNTFLYKKINKKTNYKNQIIKIKTLYIEKKINK
jgi:hypothetical protein